MGVKNKEEVKQQLQQQQICMNARNLFSAFFARAAFECVITMQPLFYVGLVHLD